jgi:hypothetical protein
MAAAEKIDRGYIDPDPAAHPFWLPTSWNPFLTDADQKRLGCQPSNNHSRRNGSISGTACS